MVYFGLGLIFLNYCVIPGLQLLAGAHLKCPADSIPAECRVAGGIELPAEFWWAWGGIVGTWAIGRSFEKAGANNRLVRAITGSQNRIEEPVG